jgi:hypothetical protein
MSDTDLLAECKLAAQSMYDAGEEASVRWLALEWTVDELVAKLIDDQMDQAWECMELISNGGYHIHDQFEYNYNCAYEVNWTYKDDFKYGMTVRAFVHTCQNYNMLYVLYDNIPAAKKVDGKYVEYRDRQLYVYHGQQEFNFPDNRRLGDLIDSGGSMYRDSRDVEYICASRDPIFHRVAQCSVIGNVSKIKMALFNLETLHYALTTADG